MLKIALADVDLLLPVNQLIEILTVPIGQVVPIFHLPPWVPGVYNWRGEVLWMIDLSHLLGLTPWYQQSDYGANHTLVVLDRPESHQLRAEERSPLGLIVKRADGMVTGDLENLATASAASNGTLDQAGEFIRGYLAGNTVPVLDGEAILAAMP
ncbi:MAG: chemotaxis protein CheW [Elainellaceae cyanobacterium]